VSLVAQTSVPAGRSSNPPCARTLRGCAPAVLRRGVAGTRRW
jgi:hypothetical protein